MDFRCSVCTWLLWLTCSFPIRAQAEQRSVAQRVGTGSLLAPEVGADDLSVNRRDVDEYVIGCCVVSTADSGAISDEKLLVDPSDETENGIFIIRKIAKTGRIQ